jgi:hypothetical protein
MLSVPVPRMDITCEIICEISVGVSNKPQYISSVGTGLRMMGGIPVG